MGHDEGRDDHQARVSCPPTHHSPMTMTSHRLSPTQTTRMVGDDELTEEERIEYEKGILTWGKVKDWRFWIRKDWTWYYVLFVVIVVIVALMTFFHHSVSLTAARGRARESGGGAELTRQIINWLTPFVQKLRDLRYGWLIPVGILFVLSFPPLFGNEIVMVLVGVVWGLGRGFAIVSLPYRSSGSQRLSVARRRQ